MNTPDSQFQRALATCLAARFAFDRGLDGVFEQPELGFWHLNDSRRLDIVGASASAVELVRWVGDQIELSSSAFKAAILHPVDLRTIAAHMPQFVRSARSHIPTQIVERISNGAGGYLTLEGATAKVPGRHLLFTLASSEHYSGYNPGALRALIPTLSLVEAYYPVYAALNRKELDVISLLSVGYSNRGVAERLFVGEETVKTHRKHIRHKTGLQTVAGLTRFALAFGLSDFNALV